MSKEENVELEKRDKMKNIWHDVSEYPNEGVDDRILVLVTAYNGTGVSVRTVRLCEERMWRIKIKHTRAEKWAYLSDFGV